MEQLLAISGLEAIAIIIATTGMYALLVLLVRLLGQRMLSSMSSYDLAAVIAFGGVVARAALGESPRLAGGVVALVTLVVLQGISGVLRKTKLGNKLLTNRPVLLVAHGKPLHWALKHCHVSSKELQSRLRQAGVGSLEGIQAVIFEPSGALSIIREGQKLDPDFFEDLIGREALRLGSTVGEGN